MIDIKQISRQTIHELRYKMCGKTDEYLQKSGYFEPEEKKTEKNCLHIPDNHYMF